MAFRVDIIPSALADLDSIYLEIKRDSPLNADHWFRGAVDAIYSLETIPARCPVVDESTELGQEVRLLLYGRRNRGYKIYFEVRHETHDTGVVRVFHFRHWARVALSTGELQELMDNLGADTGEE
jgi:plasmid stabilization system protein ParE